MELTILCGSQNGYAIETAERLQRESRQRHFKTRLVMMNDYDTRNLPLEKLVIFVCSVAGLGVEPDSMKSFWRALLRKDLPANSLSGLKFGVFGQGDSSYAKFNYPAKKLHKRLIQLGGLSLIARGDGDDQHYLGVDGALDPWSESLWTEVIKNFPLPKGLQIIPSTVLPVNSFDVEKVEIGLDEVNRFKDNIQRATVVKNNRLTPLDHFQEVRHIEMATGVNYESGDVMVVHPQNRRARVDEALMHFGWTEIADELYRFKVNPLADSILPDFLRNPISLRNIFELHLDLFGRPRRYFFHLLSFFVADVQHAEKLVEFGSTEGQNDLYTYAHKMRRTTFEVLQDFSSAKLPLNYLLDLIPLMKPKSFSISSSPLVHPASLHLTVAVVNYQTKLQTPRVGVCTDWMSTLEPLSKVRFSIAKGSLKLPSNTNVPIICIGPGTGVAPMRSLLNEWSQYSPLSRNCLIFGARNHNADYFYQEEWTKMNLLLITAFSRDQEDKIYVQHRIKEHAKELWAMIEGEGAYIYLSGNSKRMPVDVAEALVYVIQTEGNLALDKAELYLKNLESIGRFQQECWS